MFLVNRANLDDATTWASSIFSGINFLMNSRFVNSVSNAINNISAHYDISNDMFASFLSKDMTYSCAIFESKDEPLEIAQYRKLDRVIRQARIQPEDHVLEIGSGWGSFAIRAVQKTGCRVTTLTLSIEQKVLAEERVRAASLQDRISVVLCDYRKHVPARPYDKVVSIEMIEAVGREFLETYFAKVDECLKKEGGIAVFQVITMPETRYERYCKEVDFIRKWVYSYMILLIQIFPGGHCPTVSGLVSAINAGSRGTMIVDRIDNIGGHYAITLRLWREQFMANFDTEILPALRKRAKVEGKQLNEDDALIFKRKWEVFVLISWLTIVLLRVLRGGILDQDVGRRDCYGWKREYRGIIG